ncbi:polysaccharide deacetylase family protein [Actinoplanes sp. NPDC049265]|uniref:polysaccharide deacetylase family protein n=1 Tax=Actinoplanes sp. NPDC049265 TaxID=3363902 RepID=UPI00371AB698
MVRRISRRAVLRAALLGGAGAAAGVAAAPAVRSWCGWDRPPVSGGYAAAADDLGVVAHPDVNIHYRGRTSEKLVAFTFDDGPAPHWTPAVLDVLDAAGASATFFMVGRNLARHHRLVDGRLARHAIGNHSWSHPDLATLDQRQVYDELHRTHEVIREHTGRTPEVFRPPFGHLGGSAVLAADRMGYDIVLWSDEMHERSFGGDPQAQAKFIVDSVRPGSIVLAHDAGDDRRLITVDGLAAMIDGLRRRGFRLVTVPELLAANQPAEPSGPALALH